MKAELKLLEGMSFVASAESGPGIVLDASPEVGGQNRGARPLELMLMSLGGCTAMDVMHILRKSRQEVTDCKITVEADRAESHPKVFTKIHVHYVVTGKNLSDKHVSRAIKLSSEKFCSASEMLKKVATLTHDYEIVEA
ncbi:OsmC family protein [Myxococcota bacterium]|nr:OsmC family protein [Myxococcota bacterium]